MALHRVDGVTYCPDSVFLGTDRLVRMRRSCVKKFSNTLV